jgi:hypothetical protein
MNVTLTLIAKEITMNVLPAGITTKHHFGEEQDSIYLPGHGHVKNGTPHINTFDVKVEHKVLPGDNTGVRFNVETVPDALPQHKKKHILQRDEYLNGLSRNGKIRLEAASCYDDDVNLISVGGHGFHAACIIAFAQHLPLGLSPDHIWTLVTYAFAKHVDTHAEELRSNFVAHEGKKKLLIRTPGSFLMSDHDGNADSGASDKEWEKFVFPEFSKQIKTNIGDKTHTLLTDNFSTSTPASIAASEIVLMSAMKNYFSYGMSTTCGIPNITLTGVEEDWVSLRHRTEALGKLMKKDFALYWMPLVLPILDEFIESFRGDVNHGFWQSMVKLRNNGHDSDFKEWISGWMQIFFPYLKSGELNTNLHPWQDMYFSGPEPKDFPSIIASAPVEWDYHGTDFEIDFNAGFTGVSQRGDDGMISPELGWYVTHDSESKKRKQCISYI